MFASDEDLLLAAAAKDGDAFEAFFRRHAPSVLGFFASRVDDPEIAADLMAETFAGAVLGLRRFRRRPEPATSWLFAIARNKLYDHYRREAVQRSAMDRLGVERRALDDADLARIEQLSAVADLGVLVRDGLMTLPDDQRRAVEAHVVDERSYREIAAEDGTSEAVVRKRVSRGLQTLRKRLERP